MSRDRLRDRLGGDGPISYEPSRRKIERANEHIAELENLIADFGSRDPYRLIAEFKMVDAFESYAGTIPAHQAYHYRIVNSLPLPKKIGVIFGDVIHNLRASLDYIAYGIVKKCDGDTENCHFPFAKDFQSLSGRVQIMFPDAPEIKDKFLCLETCEGGKGDSLWRMNRLDNFDKHRTLLVHEFITSFVGGGVIPGELVMAGIRGSNRHPGGSILVSTTKFLPDNDATLAFEVVISEEFFRDESLIQKLKFLSAETVSALEDLDPFTV